MHLKQSPFDQQGHLPLESFVTFNHWSKVVVFWPDCFYSYPLHVANAAVSILFQVPKESRILLPMSGHLITYLLRTQVVKPAHKFNVVPR